PEWHLGSLSWRSVTIPVISFEGLNNQPVEGDMLRVPMAVINSFLGEDALPFYAIRITGIPRLVRVASADLEIDAGKTLAAERVRVNIGENKAAIPDLDFIERKMLDKEGSD
ncbi:MAG: chemotaxis protein CheW, partial [Gammaproteobacteria bacterium]